AVSPSSSSHRAGRERRVVSASASLLVEMPKPIRSGGKWQVFQTFLKADIFTNGTAGLMAGGSIDFLNVEVGGRLGVGTTKANVYVELSAAVVGPPPDPDSGYNGKGLIGPGYGGYGVAIPANYLNLIQKGLGISGYGCALPAGMEFSLLDLISEINFLNGIQVIASNAPATVYITTPDYIFEDDYVIVPQRQTYTVDYGDDDDDDNGGSEAQTTRELIEQIKDEGLSPTAPEPVYRAPAPEIESRTGQAPDDPRYTGPRPILLDLDGNGIRITEQSRSGVFVDAGGDGLLHRTAWAGAGDGVRACRAADRRSGPRQDDRRTGQSAGARRRVIALSRAALPG
ncbi:hypothetical protein, partial [Phaeovulum sp.]|uniref:hypothetical protein n=1 Tax=Phaeovulum sp. TaxID=2934796 RepID=UPI0027320E14